MNLYLKCITFLLFVYNTILGYVVIQVTNSSGRLPLLVLIVIDYVIIWHFTLHSASIFARYEKKTRARSKRKRRAKAR
jgi:hypothetical protein